MKNQSHKSLYEHINSVTLRLIGFIVKALPYLNNNSQRAYVLCYHSVSDSGWRFSTRAKDFEDQIKFLKENFRIISLDQLLSGKKGVAITFDDGYLDIYQNALPILTKHKLKATVFAIGNSNSPNREKLQNNLKLMNSSHYRKLHKLGWEIGFHTSTHPNLNELTEKEIEEEISEGKRILEKNLGFKLKYFAYPLGIYNEAVVKTVKKAGFIAAFTINGGQVTLKNRLLVDRIALEGDTDIKPLTSRLGIAVNKLFMFILRQKAALDFQLAK